MTIQTDVIAEYTAGAGVTIDGRLFKDGIISAEYVHNGGAYTNSQNVGMYDGTTVYGAFVSLRGRDFSAASQYGWINFIADSRNVDAGSGCIAFLQYDGSLYNTRILLDKVGNVGIGMTSFTPGGKIHAITAADSAVPVLRLDQLDVSEEMIELTCVAGVGNAIEAVGIKTLTVTEYIKVTVNAQTRYIATGTIS